MKNSKAGWLPAIALILILFGSCSVVGGIFNAGMSVGIFLVLLVLVVIGVLVFRSSRK